jgi:hypothetical protein
MYNIGPYSDFTAGVDGIRVILRALATSNIGEVKRILDLP